MRFEEIKDKPVVSVAEGTEIGKVRDLLLDGSYLQLAAVVIGGGGLFGGPRQIVPFEALRGIGPDAVMIPNHDAVEEVQRESAFAALPALGDLHQEVMSEGGVHLGRVADAGFDPKTGTLTELWVRPSGNGSDQHDHYAVAREDIVSVSAKMAVVRHR